MRYKNNEDKIKNLFEAFKLIKDISDVDFSNFDFLKDDVEDDFNSDSSSNEDD